MAHFGAAIRFPLEALFEINARCLGLMIEAAKAPSDGAHPILSRLHNLLLEMTPAALDRIAQSRILLVDLRFTDVRFWSTLASPAQRLGRRMQVHPVFPQRGAAILARSTLTFSWHALLASPEIGAVTLGAHREVAQIIAAMRIADLERAGRQHSQDLMPRWAGLSAVWMELIDAAQRNDMNALKISALHGLQLSTTEDCLA